MHKITKCIIRLNCTKSKDRTTDDIAEYNAMDIHIKITIIQCLVNLNSVNLVVKRNEINITKAKTR